MENNKPKVVVVAPQPIHKIIVEMFPNWDVDAPFETATDFASTLSNKSDRKIHPDTSLVVVAETLFQNSLKLLGGVVTHLAEKVVVGVLVSGNRENQKAFIDAQIDSDRKSKKAIKGKDFNDQAPYYYISYSTPKTEMQEAIKSFVEDLHVPQSARNNARKLLPETSKTLLDDVAEEDLINKSTTVTQTEKRERGKCVVITSPKGGGGKSTTTLLLSSYIKKANREAIEQGLRGTEDRPLRALVIDMDIRDTQLDSFTKEPNEGKKTIIEIQENFDGYNVTREQLYLGVTKDNADYNVDFIYGSPQPEFVDYIPMEFWKALLETAVSEYDFVFVDTPVGYTGELMKEVVIPKADEFVLITTVLNSSIKSMQRWISIATRSKDGKGFGVPSSRISVLVNNFVNNAGQSLKLIDRARRETEVRGLFPHVGALAIELSNAAALPDLYLPGTEFPTFQASLEALAEHIVDTERFPLVQPKR